ncbi:MAG: hypothetical protein JNM18_07775 [Planctomycetaceae bacterium]|nr:hypothetical protein [Planctomycetaceae bacterium]
MTGYLSREYAESLGEWGVPLELPRSGGWLLVRGIQGGERDAMGLYPRFCCQDWSQLADDLQILTEATQPLVSVALVTDPFADLNESELTSCFSDRCKPFKTHFTVDLSQSPAEFVSSHHRYYTRVAQRTVQVEVIEQPAAFLDEWDVLYAHLAQRHNLRGIKRFSPTAFAQQLAVPGIVAFRAYDASGTVGAQLWYVQGDYAYNHLAAFTPEGYKANASYALYHYSLDYFFQRVRWLDLGASAGLDPASDDGLSRFKRGWSNCTRRVFFAGKILDPRRYQELCRDKNLSSSYFPLYRDGELA